MESEGHAEKYRAVIDGGHPEDEPVGQRWGKVEPALRGRRRSHSPTAPRCLRTARYGRTACDLRRTGRVSGGTGVSRPISESEVASEALSVVGRLNITYEAWRKPCDRATGDRSGSGKAADEDGRAKKGSQMSKEEGGRNSSFSEKPVRSRPRRLADWINPTGAKKVHSLIDKGMASMCLPISLG